MVLYGVRRRQVHAPPAEGASVPIDANGMYSSVYLYVMPKPVATPLGVRRRQLHAPPRVRLCALACRLGHRECQQRLHMQSHNAMGGAVERKCVCLRVA